MVNKISLTANSMKYSFFTERGRKNRALPLLISLLLLSGCSTSRKPASEPASPAPPVEQESVIFQDFSHYIDSVETAEKKKTLSPGGTVDVDFMLAQMTLREKIGQLFFTVANGYFQSEDSENYLELVEKIRRYHIGGVMFSNGNIYSQAMLHNKLQEISEIPLWFTQDMEYGAAMRVSRTTRLTPAMGISATGNPDYAFWAGRITAREAKALGVHQIFAPVLDVNNNPENPVINVRSYSGDPQTVALFGNAFIEGVQSEGVVATAKHFPGHGDTDVDSHLSLPVIPYPYGRLDTLELVPFRAAISKGISSIMSAHIAFTGINGSGSIPGTMDENILNRILVDSLQFEGMIVTDGLEMQGISSQYSPGDAVVSALKAGADLMLLSPDEITAIHEVEQAVQRGIVTEARIDRSVRKLLEWKKQHGLFDEPAVDLNQLARKISTREHQLVADEIARKSVTVVKNEDDVLPVLPHKFPRVMIVSIADDESGRTGSYFASRMRDYHPDISFHVYDRRTGEQEKEDMLRDAKRADLIVFGSFIYVRSAQPMQLSTEQLSFLKKLAAKEIPSVLVAFGNPYIVRDLKGSEAQVMAWSANSDQVRNTVPALFGASRISGKMPISIPGHYRMGHGIEIPQTIVRHDEPETAGFSIDSLKKIDHIMQEAVFDSSFPGGTVTVLKDGVIAFQKGYGYQTYDKLQKVEDDDVYDLASLTKVVATTAAVMKLVDEGKIHLDDKISTYIPEYNNGDKKQITIRNLLSHDAGLPPFRVYVDSLKVRKQIIQAIKEEPLVSKPGTVYSYSDLGFILLAEIVEEVTGTRLDRYVRRSFFYPMNMSSTHFNPSGMGYWMRRRIAPTEIDTVFRKDTVHTVVHDERAFYMDGVAGHAGLFSSGTDLAIFSQMLINNGSYGGRRYLSPEVVEMFTTTQAETSNRGLGFDRKSEGFSTAGKLTGPGTFGHTGFTGTSIWIDPERDLSIILLTNRVHPYRSYGHNISQIRAAVADAVISSIIRK